MCCLKTENRATTEIFYLSGKQAFLRRLFLEHILILLLYRED